VFDASRSVRRRGRGFRDARFCEQRVSRDSKLAYHGVFFAQTFVVNLSFSAKLVVALAFERDELFCERSDFHRQPFAFPTARLTVGKTKCQYVLGDVWTIGKQLSMIWESPNTYLRRQP
jgi:hypothetical protein